MRNLFAFFCAALLFSSCVKDRTVPPQTVTVNPNSTLIHYWNFNGTSTTAPAFTVGGGILSFDFTTVSDTTGYADLLSPVVPTTNINAQNGDAPGNALRVRNPCTDLIITAPTTGYTNIVLSYSVAKSNNGASTDNISYTTNGTNYITTGLSTVSYNPNVDPAYTLETFDFSSIAGVNNNANFKFKITFSNGNMTTSGNDRFDNITVTGVATGSNTGGSIPVISSAATASGTINTAFAGYTIAASNTPTSFSIGGSLPTGLTLNNTTGVISGTPTASGTFIDTIKATNAKGTGTQVLTITISASASIALLHYWNFNNNTSLQTLIAPTSTIGGGALSMDFTTISAVTGYYDSVTSTAGMINAQNADADGDALRVRNPSTDLIIAAPTTNYKNIILSYAVEGSSTKAAALTNTISYTTDGINYVNTGLASTSYSLSNYIDPLYASAMFDFSSIPAVNNNANFKIKITFSDGNSNTTGNDRFDNITVQGYHQ